MKNQENLKTTLILLLNEIRNCKKCSKCNSNLEITSMLSPKNIFKTTVDFVYKKLKHPFFIITICHKCKHGEVIS